MRYVYEEIVVLGGWWKKERGEAEEGSHGSLTG